MGIENEKKMKTVHPFTCLQNVYTIQLVLIMTLKMLLDNKYTCAGYQENKIYMYTRFSKNPYPITRKLTSLGHDFSIIRLLTSSNLMNACE